MQTLTLMGTYEQSLGSTVVGRDGVNLSRFRISFEQYGSAPDGVLECVAYGRTAERCERLAQGQVAIFQGYINQDEFQGKRSTDLIVQNIVFLKDATDGELNQVAIVGRLGSDPDVKYFADGRVVAKASIAVSKMKANVPPNWFRVEFWDKQADTFANYCRKGSLVGIQGILKYETWESQGEAKSGYKISANSLRLLGRKDEEANDQPQATPQASSSAIPW